ncbi:IclR family transcriptional regulator [Paenarthrobacter sp. GOM3]|uniref:IclR family transcriptional regulator n=1 Tax=Paenarthrobacter sp. GOM3 TaxID=2782567 RepID=UPI001BAC82B5|nr:IclR family transcriptional regulator [Paenarthrobacter sp. GOM3]WOH18181.1 IclR family transcriptional regulator [Paenarthrobacter sp. GOM3]
MENTSALEEQSAQKSATRTLSSASRALGLLEAIAEHRRPVKPPTLSRQLGWSRATLHQHLVTFVNAGWLEQLEDGSYRLSMRASRVGRAAMEQSSIGERVLPLMRQLTEATRESTFLAVLDGDAAHIVERMEPRRRIRADISSEMSWALDDSASGRVLTAFADPAVVDELRATGAKLSTQTELARVRRNGYAVSAREPDDEDMITAVAVPLMDDRGYCVAALGVLGPEERLDIEDVARRLQAGADNLHALWHPAN